MKDRRELLTYRFSSVTVFHMEINPAALKAVRENGGHSQLSLAKASGVSQGHISDIEAKPGPVPIRPATAKKLATALNVPIAAITVPDSIGVAS